MGGPDAEEDRRDAGLPPGAGPRVLFQHALQRAQYRLQQLALGCSHKGSQACTHVVFCIASCNLGIASLHALPWLAQDDAGDGRCQILPETAPQQGRTAHLASVSRHLLTHEDGICKGSNCECVTIAQGMLQGLAGADLHS